MPGFVQILDPVGSVTLSALAALLPLAVLLVALAGLRLTGWVVVAATSLIAMYLAVLTWRAPLDGALSAYGLGAATGLWSVDWIVFWGVVIYNTLRLTGALTALRLWLLDRAGRDIRVQTMLVAWAFGALLEGLVGFGYPWAVIAPILIGLGMAKLDAIRVAALANNAPVSYGALGAPLVALAAVTGLPLAELSASVGGLTAALAVAPPFVLLYLVSGWKGLREGWPLALVGAGGFIAGQLPTAVFLGPYLPAVIGALTCFAALQLLGRYWSPPTLRGVGGHPLAPLPPGPPGSDLATRPLPRVPAPSGGTAVAERVGAVAAAPARDGAGRALRSSAARGLVPLGILVAVVVAWTGPWSPLPGLAPLRAAVTAGGSLGGEVSASFTWAPFAAGTAILTAWALICAYLRPGRAALRAVFTSTLTQMWAALLIAPLIFGLATVFNYAGMANSLANGFARLGPGYVLLAPMLGWIAVALSGSNTSANTIFGAFQLSVGRILGAPPMLFPALNSVGAEIGKPVAPQSASVGVATTGLSGHEGRLIRHNIGWTLALLGYLTLVGLLAYLLGL